MLRDVFDKVLVISPHADDEVIGCGGLMRKVINQGGEVHVVVAAIGDIKFYHLDRIVTKEERKHELHEALATLGVDSYVSLFDDYESLMDTLPIRNVITSFDQIISKLQPTAIFLPFPSFHQDHKVVFNAGFAALRPRPEHNSFLRLVAVYEYPFVSWTNENLAGGEFYIDIKEELADKIRALECHKSQLRDGKHLISPETVQLWAEKRGIEAGLPYAEKYNVLRLLV